MTYHHDKPSDCFEHAIFAGVLSNRQGHPRYAGQFMYMHSDERFDYFKHISTRQYVKSPLIC